MGIEIIKFNEYVSPDAIKAGAEEAKSLGLPVTCHCLDDCCRSCQNKYVTYPRGRPRRFLGFGAGLFRRQLSFDCCRDCPVVYVLPLISERTYSWRKVPLHAELSGYAILRANSWI